MRQRAVSETGINGILKKLRRTAPRLSTSNPIETHRGEPLKILLYCRIKDKAGWKDVKYVVEYDSIYTTTFRWEIKNIRLLKEGEEADFDRA